MPEHIDNVQEQFELTDDTAFALCAAGSDKVAAQCRTRRDRSLKLAMADSYGGRQIVPLARMFKVSPKTMAIRLEELDLVA